jgi:hypothetical protein
MISQRTPEWFLERKGLFTASEIWKLMQSGRKKDELFGEGAKTYIREKSSEVLMTDSAYLSYLEEMDFKSYAMQRGIELEDEARNTFAERYKKKVDEVGFEKLNNYSGGSSDGNITKEKNIIEIKCPSPSVHLDYLYTNNILEAEPKYYYQMQLNMMCWGFKSGYFISYDPRYRGKLDLYVEEVNLDESIAEEMLMRIEEAGEMRDEMINKIVEKVNK